MKKTAFLLFVILSFYIAGLYRYPPLLILSTAELLLLPLLFFLTRYFRRCISVEPARRSEMAEKEEELVCEIRVSNSGRLPVSRFGLRVGAWYDKSRTQVYKAVLYGGCDRGESTLHFSVAAAHCGLMRISLDRIRVYDYLSLFFAGKRLQEEITAAVFPASGAMRLTFADAGNRSGEPERTQDYSGAEDSRDEIRQIREYRVGDLSRHIHWNQSARTDTLWIREYERETEKTAEIRLCCGQAAGPGKNTGWEKKGGRRKKEDARPEQTDAFYEILWALLLGLLEQGIRPRVTWRSGKDEKNAVFWVLNREGCRELFWLLYRNGFPDNTAWEDPEKSAGRETIREGFCLTGALELYWNGRLLYRFHPQKVQQEMEERVFVI